MNPADGVIMTRPEIAPRNKESRDNFPVSKKVTVAQVKAPAEAHTLVTIMVMTALKLKAKTVPASKASHEPHMVMSARA